MNRHVVLLTGLLCCVLHASGQADWQNVPTPEPGQYARVLCATEPYLYGAFETTAGTQWGLYRTPSPMPGVWEHLGFSGTRIYDVVELTGDPSVLLVAVQDSGKVYRSTDQGGTWVASGASLPGGRATTLQWDGGSPGRVYCVTGNAGSWGTSISASTDRGLSWTTVMLGGSGNSRMLLSTRGDGSPNVWRTSYDGYWTSPTEYSSDAGQTWNWIGQSIWDGPPTALCTPSATVWTYSLVQLWTIYRWNANTPAGWWGTAFEAVGMETPPWWPGRVVTCGVTEGGQISVAHRADGEASWTFLDDGLPDDSSPSPDQNWWRFVLESGASRPVLYYGTWTLGLWMRDVSDVVGVEESAQLSAGLRVVPNPAGANVSFSLTGPSVSPLELRIVDAAGRQVALRRGETARATWNFMDDRGRAVPSGIYYVRARTASGAAGARFVHIQ